VGRDWESHVYFEHRPLTPALVEDVLRRLAGAGLRLGAPAGEDFPALRGFRLDGSGPVVIDAEIDELLRSRPPPVGSGYGVLPLLVQRPGLSGEGFASLTFARPDPATGLDGATLVVDGALFRSDEETALEAAFAWFGVLCESLDAAYGWADWETASFLVAAPSRREVRAGSLPRLMRFNALGRGLFASLPAGAIERAPRLHRAGDLVIFERPASEQALST
jgi:hypothetical protein